MRRGIFYFFVLFTGFLPPASAGLFDELDKLRDCLNELQRQLPNILSVRRISLAPNGSEANRASGTPDISADGQRIAFMSLATNLHPEDGNDLQDIYLFDRENNALTLVSADGNGQAGNNHSFTPRISADGSHVIFTSLADNLVPEDGNGGRDVFIYAVATGNLQRISVAPGGGDANGESEGGVLSGNGKKAVFSSAASNLDPTKRDANNRYDIFVADRGEGSVRRVTFGWNGGDADGDSHHPDISEDGKILVFDSHARNLIREDRNGRTDIFVKIGDSPIRRVSVGHDGSEANGASHRPRITADGGIVVFESRASNLVAGDRDNNRQKDIFLYDLKSGRTSRISSGRGDAEANGESHQAAIAGNGGLVISGFGSRATNLTTDIEGDLRRAIPGYIQEMLSWGDDELDLPDFPQDRNGVEDVFIQFSGWTVRASINARWEEGNGWSETPSLASKALSLVFTSAASNMVEGDRNNAPDIFVADIRPPVVECPSALMGEIGLGGGGGNGIGLVEKGNGERPADQEGEPIATCEEQGDGGPDPFLRGRVLARDEEGNIRAGEDRCCGKRHLEEFNCADGFQVQWYRCNGCLNGACLRRGNRRTQAERLRDQPRECR